MIRELELELVQVQLAFLSASILEISHQCRDWDTEQSEL